MSDMDLNFSFGGSDERPNLGATSSADRDSDSTSSGRDLSPRLEFPVMEPVKDSPKWTVGTTPAGISYEDYRDVINAVYTLYTQEKALPTLDRVAGLAMVSYKTIKTITESREFISAMQSRGVPWTDSKGLTSQQMLALQVLTNPTDKRPLAAKLKSIGITYPVYRGWMGQPAFSQYMFKITEGMLTEHLPDFNTVLTNKGLAGDLNAIRYINELSGRHDPNRQQVVDLVAIVEKLLDIIQRNVTDPEVFQRIAAEFSMTVSTKTTLQGEITRGPNT